jgi:hypothetical protein
VPLVQIAVKGEASISITESAMIFGVCLDRLEGKRGTGFGSDSMFQFLLQSKGKAERGFTFERMSG